MPLPGLFCKNQFINGSTTSFFHSSSTPHGKQYEPSDFSTRKGSTYEFTTARGKFSLNRFFLLDRLSGATRTKKEPFAGETLILTSCKNYLHKIASCILYHFFFISPSLKFIPEKIPSHKRQATVNFRSRLARRQWSLVPNANVEDPPCQEVNSSGYFGISKKSTKILF